jgi:hypothetical protein
MAKIAPPPAQKSRKGAPPPLARTVANLDKPEPTALRPLNLKVPPEFKRELKTYAAQQGRTMTDLLIEGYNLLRSQRG